MSDRSSESSGEWIVLNEEEEGFILDNNEPSLNLELNYDGICHAVSDSIRSSLSSEELEWQYEQYEDYIPPLRPSFIQEVHFYDGQITDDCESEDSNVEDDIINKSTSDIEEVTNIGVASISKIHSYKHNRNDRLNFILNFTLALVLASAVGLGVGHFLGWSHKCFKSTPVIYKAVEKAVESSHVDLVKQPIEVSDNTKNYNNLPLLSDSALDSIPCTSLKMEGSSAHHDISSALLNSNFAESSGLAEPSIFVNSDLLELKTPEDISQSNFSNPQALSIIPNSDVLDIDWDKLSSIEAAVKKIYGLKEDNIDIGSLIDDDEINNIELKLLPENKIKDDVSDVVYDREIPPSLSENNKLFFKNKLNSDEFEFLTENFNDEKFSSGGNDLTSQLHRDLNEVVQSLTAIALARLADVDEKYLMSVEKSESIIKLFDDFQTLLNTRISDIDYFLHVEYKNAPKFNLKYLRKMVYTLVNSVDYLMKVSFKTLEKDGKKINVHKFSNNISKVISNFNKKWEKNNQHFLQSSEKFRVKHFQETYVKKGKESKFLKNKTQFEKHNKKNYKNKRYSMKS